MEEDDNDEDMVEQMKRKEQLQRRKFTLKRLIRLLHINEPVSHVLSLLGKK